MYMSIRDMYKVLAQKNLKPPVADLAQLPPNCKLEIDLVGTSMLWARMRRLLTEDYHETAARSAGRQLAGYIRNVFVGDGRKVTLHVEGGHNAEIQQEHEKRAGDAVKTLKKQDAALNQMQGRSELGKHTCKTVMDRDSLCEAMPSFDPITQKTASSKARHLRYRARLDHHAARISRTTAVAGALAQRQAVASIRIHTAAAFHSSAAALNTNNKSNSGSSSSSNNSSNIPDILRPSSPTRAVRQEAAAAAAGRPAACLAAADPRTRASANTTANPIHLDTSHPNEGRSFRVASPAAVDQTYRRLRSAINQSNMKRELRLKRNYETGHARMRRENQERNKKLFGAMVRKKIELIKLMKIRGM
ncbi:unnamed protein product [Mortierella alpina]